LKYADLLWGDEKLRRITLEELCRSWNLTTFGCGVRQAGIMERVLNAGGQENLSSCGHLPSSGKTLFREKR
jgi:hypothetical protein